MTPMLYAGGLRRHTLCTRTCADIRGRRCPWETGQYSVARGSRNLSHAAQLRVRLWEYSTCCPRSYGQRSSWRTKGWKSRKPSCIRIILTAVQYEMNKTHGHSLLLCQGAYPKQDPLFGALPYRGNVGRLFYETAPRVSFHSSSQSHYGR